MKGLVPRFGGRGKVMVCVAEEHYDRLFEHLADEMRMETSVERWKAEVERQVRPSFESEVCADLCCCLLAAVLICTPERCTEI